MLSTRPRRILATVLVIFAIYAVMVSPTQAADVVRQASSWLGNGLHNVGRFFDALLKR